MGLVHLGHYEVRVRDLEASTKFFTEVIGLFESGADGERVYLRAWQDWDHHTLILKQDERLGLEHVGWRVESADDLDRFARVLKEQGMAHEWFGEGRELGQGEALRFKTPEGHSMELYVKMEKFSPGDGDAVSPIPSHPSKYTGRGMAPRRIDHLGIGAIDVNATRRWLQETLGMRFNYWTEDEDENATGAWLSNTNVSHEISVVRSSEGGKLHHIAYFVDSAEELLRGAKIMAENGHLLEWGPTNHATSGATAVYFFEPSGNRVEVWTGGMLIFDPDWEPIRWAADTAKLGFDIYNSSAPPTFFTVLT